MVHSCCAYNCTERASKESNISFHRFPSDPDLKKRWILATRWENFNPSKQAVLCSKHFHENDFLIYVGKRRLHEDAVPSIFNFPKHLLKNTISRKSKRSLVLTEDERHLSLEEQGTSKTLELHLSLEEQGTSKTLELHENLEMNPGRKRHFGDYKEEDLSDPKKAKLMWQCAKETITLKNKKIKFYQNKNARLQRRVCTLKNLLTDLKQTREITNDCFELLDMS